MTNLTKAQFIKEIEGMGFVRSYEHPKYENFEHPSKIKVTIGFPSKQHLSMHGERVFFNVDKINYYSQFLKILTVVMESK